MEESENDKTEEPTPYKLDRSRRKGVVARGVDLGFMASLLALFGYAWIAGPQFGGSIVRVARDSWISGPELADGHALVSAAVSISALALRPLVFLMIVVFATVLLFEFVQTGVVFSAQPLSPDFSRLNPANGLKRVFSLRAFIETFKNILKLLVYAGLGVLTARAALQAEIGTVTDAPSLFALLHRSGLRLLAAFVLGAVFFAVLDQLIVRKIYFGKMRMSRRELRRESRDREGEPRLKQKRRQLHRELAKSSQSLRNLRKADVLIANPDHIAIALRYDPKSMAAPMVVSIGVNHLAQRLKRIAFLYSIPIVENRLLAQALYRKSALNRAIPQDCYQPVANIYNALRAKLQKPSSERTHD
jgi:flagellar biosynthetic protein FlhB